MKKKAVKQLKKEIVNNTAINVGYYNDVLNQLPAYALIEAVKEIAQNQFINTQNDKQIENILITESVKYTSYQDFKNLTNYFFK